MIPALKDLTPSRIVSAVGALVITSTLVLAIGLGFPAPVSAQAEARPGCPHEVRLADLSA